MATVDILMGAYNEEKYIGRAIESIIKQDYEDWRLLICDDGSKDNTVSEINKYLSYYPTKIILLTNERNKGLTYSLNRLLFESNAKYIARMDADDICLPNRLKEEVEFLECHNEFALVGSIIKKFDEEGCFGVQQYPEKPQKRDLLWNNPFAHPTVLIRRNVLVELKGYRDIPMTRRCEDYDLWMRLYEMGYRGYNIQKPLLYYFENRNSYMKRKFCFRINEARVRFDGYWKNHLFPIGLVFVLKPFVVGLIPKRVIKKYRRNI